MTVETMTLREEAAQALAQERAESEARRLEAVARVEEQWRKSLRVGLSRVLGRDPCTILTPLITADPDAGDDVREPLATLTLDGMIFGLGASGAINFYDECESCGAFILVWAHLGNKASLGRALEAVPEHPVCGDCRAAWDELPEPEDPFTPDTPHARIVAAVADLLAAAREAGL